MSAALTPPFTIGETWWFPATSSRQVAIPCPVCAGQLFVTMILGDGEHVILPCEGCGIGFNGPRGVIEEWVNTPQIERFVIAEIVRFDGSGDDAHAWTVRSEAGQTCYFNALVATEAEAHRIAEANALAIEERNMETRQRKRKDERGGWNVRYHRGQIADPERQLAWHRAKVKSKGRAK